MPLSTLTAVSWSGYYRANRRLPGSSCDELNNVKGSLQLLWRKWSLWMCSIMLEDIFIFEIKAGKDLCDGHQKKIFIPQSAIEIQDVCWWNWNISEFDDVLAHYLGYGLNTKDMNKELLYVLVSGGEAKIHCILFYCTELKNNHCRL